MGGCGVFDFLRVKRVVLTRPLQSHIPTVGMWGTPARHTAHRQDARLPAMAQASPKQYNVTPTLE